MCAVCSGRAAVCAGVRTETEGGRGQCGTVSGRRWRVGWVFGFSPPWEKWEGRVCAARTFFDFLTHPGSRRLSSLRGVDGGEEGVRVRARK